MINQMHKESHMCLNIRIWGKDLASVTSLSLADVSVLGGESVVTSSMFGVVPILSGGIAVFSPFDVPSQHIGYSVGPPSARQRNAIGMAF